MGHWLESERVHLSTTLSGSRLLVLFCFEMEPSSLESLGPVYTRRVQGLGLGLARSLTPPIRMKFGSRPLVFFGSSSDSDASGLSWACSTAPGSLSLGVMVQGLGYRTIDRLS